MDAKLFRNFIDYMDDEEISDVDTLILDNANNTINLNGEKYKLLSFKDAEQLLQDKIKSDVEDNNYDFLKEIDCLEECVDPDKLFNYILNNYNDLELNLEEEDTEGKDLKELINAFLIDTSIKDIINDYLNINSIYYNCITLEDDDIDDIIENYKQELLEYYKNDTYEYYNFSIICNLESCFVLVKNSVSTYKFNPFPCSICKGIAKKESS